MLAQLSLYVRTLPSRTGWALLLAATVFVVDLTTPIGDVAGIGYVLPLFLSIPSNSRWKLPVVIAASIYSVLIVLGFFFTAQTEANLGIRLANRVLSLLTIWSTTSMYLLFFYTEASLGGLGGILPICTSCKKIRDGEGHWQFLESYFLDRFSLEFSRGMCPTCVSGLSRHSPGSADFSQRHTDRQAVYPAETLTGLPGRSA